MTTNITNAFTRYSATIRTHGTPAISTIQKHLRKAKCRDCHSVTIIEINGIRHDLVDLHGRGLDLIPYG
jgi:hypothetical protein